MPRVSSKDKYTRQAFELFKEKGLSLNMEEIATHLGVTKKTLYNNFESKQDLVGTVLYLFYFNLEVLINNSISKSNNAIEELIGVAKILCDEISKVGQRLMNDISMYQSCPEIFKFSDRKNFYFNLIKSNLYRGINEGLYRENLNVEYSALFYMSAIELFYHWDGKFNYFDDTQTFHRELVLQHLHSVVNSNGLRLLESSGLV